MTIQRTTCQDTARAAAPGGRSATVRVRLIPMLCLACMQLTMSLSATPGDTPTTPVLGTPVTHSDWMLHDGIEWGAPGVRHMLDMCKASGWKRIYWRALDAGRATYKSRLLDPAGKPDDDWFYNPKTPEDVKVLEKYCTMTTAARQALTARVSRFSYADFDSLAEAVRYGHGIGLEVHAWITINEDDHGWGMASRFAANHPEMRWRRRNGTAYRSQMSFAFPEVREYKLAIVREILDGYPVDGIFLDWLRTGDVRDNPQTDADGVADHGYEDPLLKAFREKYGEDAQKVANDDDRWVRLRAQPHTEYMRDVRRLANGKRPGLPISVLVANPWCYRGLKDKIDGNLRGLLLDVETWGRERLIDAAAAGGYYLDGGNSELAFEALHRETGGTVDIWLYEWVPETAEQFLGSVALARKLGAKQILLWEGDYIQIRPNRGALQNVMSGGKRP